MNRWAAVILAAFVIGLTGCGGRDSKPVAPSNPDAIAVVLGKEILSKDAERLDGIIFGTLRDKFAKDNKIKPADAEVEAVVRRTNEGMASAGVRWEQDRARLIEELKSATLSAEERTNKVSELETIESILESQKELDKALPESAEDPARQIAEGMVTTFKVNQALYEKYGGRVIFQQFGPEPVDAFRDFLEEHEEAGDFKILDPKYEDEFWDYFTNDSSHSFYSLEEGAEVMKTPWWLMPEPTR